MGRHSTQTKLDVIASYALSGNASDAARKHGVHDRTARNWIAKALEGEDPQGAEILSDAGQKLRARALDSALRLALNVIEVSAVRFHGEPAGQLDNRNQYGKLVLDGAKLFTGAARTLSQVENESVVEDDADLAAKAREHVAAQFGLVTPTGDEDEGADTEAA